MIVRGVIRSDHQWHVDENIRKGRIGGGMTPDQQDLLYSGMSAGEAAVTSQI